MQLIERVVEHPRELLTGSEAAQRWIESGFIGSRPDITNSLEYAREQRRKTQKKLL